MVINGNEWHSLHQLTWWVIVGGMKACFDSCLLCYGQSVSQPKTNQKHHVNHEHWKKYPEVITPHLQFRWCFNTRTLCVQLRIQHALTTMQQNFHIFFHCMQTQRFIGICVAWASPRVGRWAVMSSQGFRPGFQCEEIRQNIMQHQFTHNHKCRLMYCYKIRVKRGSKTHTHILYNSWLFKYR